MKWTAMEKTNLLIELVKEMNRGDAPHSPGVATDYIKYAALQVEKILEYGENESEKARTGG